MSIENLERLFALSDRIDREEGEQAYRKYNAVLNAMAIEFKLPVERVAAVFVALSPNNDYKGNLKSTVAILKAWRDGDPLPVVSTYRHCAMRAFNYASGRVDFLSTVRGLKIRSFYHNIIDPSSDRHVTVDGHMVAAWRGERLTMKEALVGARGYREIEMGIKALAFRHFMLPNAMQATLWFTRKRVYRVKFKPQLDLLRIGNQWEI